MIRHSRFNYIGVRTIHMYISISQTNNLVAKLFETCPCHYLNPQIFESLIVIGYIWTMDPDSTLPHLCQTFFRSHAPIDQGPISVTKICSRGSLLFQSAVNPFALRKTMRGKERERVAVRSAWSPERFVEPANFPTLSFQSCNPTQKIVRRLGGSWQGWTTKSILSFSLGILQFYLKTSKH